MVDDDQSCNSYHSAKSELSQIMDDTNKPDESSASTQVPPSKRIDAEDPLGSSQDDGLSVFNISSEQDDS